jgi:hypothetical protein
MVCFETKIPNLGKFLENLRMENAGICYGHLEYLTVMRYIFGHLVML